MKINSLFIIIVFSIYFSNSVIAQKSQPKILKQPVDWRYEKIDFPLDFAPELNYKGFEELRFAKGMFDRSSDTYFTYVFVVSFEEKININKKFLKEFLTKYYKGLSASVAKSKKLQVDISKIEARVSINKKSKNLEAEIVFLDTFNKGEEIKLNMEIDVINKKENNNSYLIALVSPKTKNTNIWKELYKIREKIKI